MEKVKTYLVSREPFEGLLTIPRAWTESEDCLETIAAEKQTLDCEVKKLTSGIKLKSIVHDTMLIRGVNSLFYANNVNHKLSDLQLTLDDRTFYCHKLVLQLNSEYFVNMSFQSGTMTPLDISPEQFHDVLQFMYTGEMTICRDTVESLLSAADILSMANLKKICVRFLYIILNIKNCINNALLYWRLANKYNETRLAGKCQAQVMDDFSKLNSDSRLINVSEEMIKVILRDDNLGVESEVEVCEMLMKKYKQKLEMKFILINCYPSSDGLVSVSTTSNQSCSRTQH